MSELKTGVAIYMKDPKFLVFSRTVKSIKYDNSTQEYILSNEMGQEEHVPRENVYRYIILQPIEGV